MLYQYVRKNGKRIGIVVAIELDTDNVRIGWSLCNVKLDKFDRYRGLQIAVGRAIYNSTTDIPQSVYPTLTHFAQKAKRYYKDKTVTLPKGFTGKDSENLGPTSFIRRVMS